MPKRKPVRDTGSIYSDTTIGTVSIQNIQFQEQDSQTLSRKPYETQFQPTSPSRTGLPVLNIKVPKTKKGNFCETEIGTVKKICHDMDLKPTFKTSDFKTCQQAEPLTKLLYRNITRKEFCIEKLLENVTSTSTSTSDEKEKPSKMELEKLAKKNKFEHTTKTDSSPTDIKEAQRLLNHRIPLPCPDTDAGDLRHKFVGKCTNKDMIREKRQPYDKIKQVHFTRTENAQTKTCLKNPNYKEKKLSKLAEESFIKESVKLADNIETSSEDENPAEDKICVEIDVDNPFNLDFHGFDYQSTFKTDEQDFENIREYRKIRRYADRIRRKKEIENICKEEDEIAKFSTPPYFDTNYVYDSNGEAHEVNPNTDLTPTQSSQSGHLGKLYRTEKKPINRFIIQKEEEQRDGRYRNLIQTIKERNEIIQKSQKEIKEENEKNKVLTVAENFFKELYPNQQLESEVIKKVDPKTEKKHSHPHTLIEVQQLKHKMKKKKLIAREKGKLRQHVLDDMGSSKIIEEACLSISNLSESQPTISEQSSNDDDHIKVGQVKDRYHLRGFHFRLGNEIRGKYAVTDKPPEARLNKKGCMTRDEWIDALAPHGRKETIYQRNPPQVLKVQELDDPKLCLFPPKPIAKSNKVLHPIQEEIAIPFGNQYKTFIKQVIKIKKPKTLKVKKFNLTNFIFGDEKTRMHGSISSNHFGRVHEGFGNLTEYIRNKGKLKGVTRRRKRHQRMHYLGIPRIPKIRKTGSERCEHFSDSESSDWIPEEYKTTQKIDIDNISAENFAKSFCTPFPENTKIVDFDYMPAPKFREPVLRQDPSKPKDLKSQVSALSVLKADHTDFPYLKAPPDDENIPMRLDEPKRDFMKFLNTRHHYDHWNPTQHKDLRVLYKPKYPQPKPEKETTKTTEIKETVKKTFDKATPSNLENRDIDHSLPLYKKGAIVDDTSIVMKKKDVSSKKHATEDVAKTIEYPEKDEEYHSRPRPLPDYPGREDFIKLIKEINAEIKRQEKARGRAGAEDETERMANLFDKDEFMNQMKDELRSIKSCLSSLDSSICTNFTHDSGSFLIAVDKKVPMDYIRKSLVPFEEINRTRVKATPIPQSEIETNPYKTVPFAGQTNEQLSKPEDKFHTFISRIHNDIRGRLYIPTVDMSKKKLGIGHCRKYRPRVATDLDEIYIEELHDRPPVKIFKPKTSATLIKDAQRKKFICWCIQQKLVEQKSAQEKQVVYYNSVQRMKTLFNDLFLQWQKRYYDELKQVECKIEPYYAKTDEIRRILQELDKNVTTVSMDIVYIENILIKLTVLQNFHYLLMSQVWREEHDWLHKDENGMLESFRESIEKRPFSNVRKRDRDDAWAIKEFYENEFVNNKHPIMICFPDADSFNSALNDLKSKTFVRLLELHFTLWLHTNLEHEYNQVLIWAENCNEQKEKFLETKGVKKTFMKTRGKVLKEDTEDLLNAPLADSVAALNLRKIKAFGEVLYDNLVPFSIKQSVKEDIDINDKFALISDSLLDLLAQIDELPKDIRDTTIHQYRKRLKYDTLMSIKAVEVENRIATSLNTVQRLLGPIKRKPRKEIMAKYGRMKLKKKRITEGPKEIPIPPKIRFFYEAFHDFSDIPEMTKDDQLEIENHLAGIEEESITFHFDHFLRLNDYEPNYNFKTQIEASDGPEENYMKYKDLIPHVKQQLAIWEDTRKLQIRKHIEDNPQLYFDLKI